MQLSESHQPDLDVYSNFPNNVSKVVEAVELIEVGQHDFSWMIQLYYLIQRLEELATVRNWCIKIRQSFEIMTNNNEGVNKCKILLKWLLI